MKSIYCFILNKFKILTSKILFIKWSIEDKQRFIMNLIWGSVAAFILHFAYLTGIGQQMINTAYDYLVVKDFIRSVVHGKESEPVSDHITIIPFDKTTYTNNRNGGYWTPRELLGKVIIKSLKQDSKVVLVDFFFNKPVPILYNNGNIINENTLFLSMLREAVIIAKKKKAVIIIPWVNHKLDNDFSTQYSKIINENKNVIKLASPLVYKSSIDNKVRHTNFFEHISLNDKKLIVFSMPLLAFIYHSYGIQKGDKIIKEIEINIINSKKERKKKQEFEIFSSINIYSQTTWQECIPARYKYRIIPRKELKKFGKCNDPLFDKKIRAESFIQYDDSKPLFNNKIVLIGSTFKDIGDIHSTPLGNMPGIYIIANSLNMLLKGQQIKQENIVKWLLLIVWIIVSAYIFAIITNGWEIIVLFFLIVIINTPTSTLLFSKYGIFIDFWLPSTIMGIRSNISLIENSVSNFLNRKAKNEN